MAMTRLLFLALAAALPSLTLAGCLDFGERSPDRDADAAGPTIREFDIEVGTVMLPLYPLGKDPRTGERQHAMVMGLGFSFVGDDSPPQVPGPEIRVREGDIVRVNFVNNDPFGFNHTIHWHGVHVPFGMDGNPYISQAPVIQGKSYSYEFVATPAGTHWYHCHVDATHHVDLGMYGPIIIEPRDTSNEPKYDRETTLFLDEWDKNHIHSANMSSLTPSPSGDPEETLNKFITQIRDAPYTTPEGRKVTGGTVREKRDWWPETPPPYFPIYNTFTINTRAFPFTEPIHVAEGETLKIRFIHVGGMMHSIHVHGHSFIVTHKDGYLLPAPYRADTLAIAPGERYDVLLEANNPGVWDLSCHMAGHTANDGIWPGGMMTMIAYDGYAPVTNMTVHHPGFMQVKFDASRVALVPAQGPESIESPRLGSGPAGEFVSGDYALGFYTEHTGQGAPEQYGTDGVPASSSAINATRPWCPCGRPPPPSP